jgi:hypothetical protein
VRRLAVTQSSDGPPYPRMMVNWEEDVDGLGWTGTITTWINPNERNQTTHEVNVRQTTPLGLIFVTVDGLSHGCWATAKFEGTGISERDLQWATAYASESIKRKELILMDGAETAERG